MKILRNRFYHLMQVIFPQLAIDYRWGSLNDLHLLTLLCKRAETKFTIYMFRPYISIKAMKRLVLIAECLAIYPEHHKFILEDSINMPIATMMTKLHLLPLPEKVPPQKTATQTTTVESVVEEVLMSIYQEPFIIEKELTCV